MKPPEAANEAWPRWFLPAVGGTLLASVLIFAVRVAMHWGDGTPTTEVANQTIDPPTIPPATNDVPADEIPATVTAKSSPPVENKMSGKPSATNPPEPPQPAPIVVQFAPAADQAALSNSSAAPDAAPPVATLPNDKTPPPNPLPAIDLPARTEAPAKLELPAADARPANLRTLQRVPPQLVNVNARLSDEVSGFESRGLPLVDFVALVSRLSTIPITIDADALAALGQSPIVPVQMHQEKNDVADLLDAALGPLRLGYQVRDGQLIVGAAPAEKLRQVKYAVPDLVGDDAQALQRLATVIQRMVAPASWQSSGGQGTMNAKGGALVVEQSEPAHGEILTFCEKLRIARGLPQKSRFNPAQFGSPRAAIVPKRSCSAPSLRTFTRPRRCRRWSSGLADRPARRSWWITRPWLVRK